MDTIASRLTTRRYPRTMQEAFGPYTSDHIDDGSARPSDCVLVALYIIAIAAYSASLILVTI